MITVTVTHHHPESTKTYRADSSAQLVAQLLQAYGFLGRYVDGRAPLQEVVVVLNRQQAYSASMHQD